MSFFEQNMAALSHERRSQKAYLLLQEIGLDSEEMKSIELFETDHADYTVKYQNIFLHHVQGAQKEAEAICDKEGQLHPHVRANHIILGIGLGYVLDEVFQRSDGKIFIYEPLLPMLRFTFENVDLSRYIASQRVYIATTIPELLRQMSGRYMSGEPLDVLVTQCYAALLAPEIPTIMGQLLSFVEEQRSNVNVGLAYHLKWVEYFINNIPFFPKADTFDTLVGQYANKAALVVSSGPSLDKAMPTIKACRDRFVLLAVGGALRPLLAAGIEPDFAVFLDYQGPKEQLALLPSGTHNIRFLCGPFVDPACFTAEAKSHHLLALHNYPVMADWIDQALDESRHRIRAGATVSMTAIESALAMGCNPIILTGQDLALTDGYYYAGGVEANFSENGFASLSDSDTLVGRTVEILEIQGQDGNLLKTTPDYFSYRKHLSELAHELYNDRPDIQLFNASVGGALIPGFTHLPLEKIIEDYPQQAEMARQPHIQEQSNSQNNTIKLRQGIESLQQKLRQAGEQAQTVWRHVEALSRSEAPDSDTEAIYKEERKAFSDLLNETPFIEYCLRKEIWQLQESFCFTPNTQDEIRHNWKVDTQYFENSAKLIQQTLVPLVEKCLASFQDVSPQSSKLPTP